jgi:hypothetical protein
MKITGRSKLTICVLVMLAVACTRTQATKDEVRSAASTSKPTAYLSTITSVPADTLMATGSDIEKTRSGVATRVMRRGTGARHPTADDGVILYSQVYDKDGRVIGRWDGFVGDPAKDLNRTGFEAVQMMVEGEVRRIWFPDTKSRGGTKITDYEITWITPRPKDEGTQATSTR